MELPGTACVTIAEAARRAGVQHATISRWVRREQLAGLRLGRAVRVFEDDLERVIEQRRAAAEKALLLRFMREGSSNEHGKLHHVMQPGRLCYRCTMETERPGMLCEWCADESRGRRLSDRRLIEPAMSSSCSGHASCIVSLGFASWGQSA